MARFAGPARLSQLLTELLLMIFDCLSTSNRRLFSHVNIQLRIIALSSPRYRLFLVTTEVDVKSERETNDSFHRGSNGFPFQCKGAFVEFAADVFDFYRKDIPFSKFGVEHCSKAPLGIIWNKTLAGNPNPIPETYAEWNSDGERRFGGEDRLEWDGWACMAKLLFHIDEKIRGVKAKSHFPPFWTSDNPYAQLSHYARDR